MSAGELDRKEKDSFLEWRRELAELQEIEGIVMTPFERNLDFWRQLWRVIERRFGQILFQICCRIVLNVMSLLKVLSFHKSNLVK